MKLEASIMKSFIHFLVLFSLMWQIKADCDVEVAEELYWRCAHRQTERLHFLSSPRWNPGGNINETAICDALTDLTICGIETECNKMIKGILYTTASQLYTKSTTRDLDCAKAFIGKYGNFDDDFPEPGSCSTDEGSPDEEFSQFADCMIPNFEWVKNATGQNLCDALKAISNCKTAHPKCQNEYVGLAYGIANYPLLGDKECIEDFIENTRLPSALSESPSPSCNGEDAERLLYCTQRQREASYILSSLDLRFNRGFINETAICEELTDWSECEKETACKEMASGMWYTIASQLNTRSTTRDIDCVKSFMEKYGKFDEEPGTCSGWNPDERTPFVEFAECMIDPFDSVRNAETEEELCEPLEEISKCEAANPKCKNEFVGHAYGIAQYVESYNEGQEWGACVQKFIEKHGKTLPTGTTTAPSEPSGSVWKKIEKLNEKFLQDLKLLLPSA